MEEKVCVINRRCRQKEREGRPQQGVCFLAGGESGEGKGKICN